MPLVPCYLRCSHRITVWNSLRRSPWTTSRAVFPSTLELRQCFHSSRPALAEGPKISGVARWDDKLESVEGQGNSRVSASSDFWNNAPVHTFAFGSRIPNYKIGTEAVSAVGFLEKVVTVSKTLTFARLRGPSPQHSVQIVCYNNPAMSHAFKEIRVGSSINVRGLLRRKVDPKSGKSDNFDTALITQNNTLDPSQVEIHLESIQCLNSMAPEIPISTPEKPIPYPPQSRYLQIRFDQDLGKRLQFRSDVAAHVRYLLRNFQEIETPILFKSTPEGAREFLVPTRRKGHAYALPQSPQQYKQILMASGISKYFQFAKCFRDEDLRADRQPEFTQIDLEMAWSTGQRVMWQVEGVIKDLYGNFRESEIFTGGVLPDRPFLQMPYQTAMSCYGSDKPDLRIGGKILNISDLVPTDLKGMLTSIKNPIVDAWRFRTGATSSSARSFVRKFMDSQDAAAFRDNPDGAPGVCIYDPRSPLEGLQTFGHQNAEQIKETWSKLEGDFEEGDIFLLQARPTEPLSGGSTVLGKLRLAVHKAAVAEGLVEQDPSHHYLWIVDFPMFTPDNGTDPGQGGTSGFSATHHPFTAPKTAADVDLLLSNPLLATADHYDLVVNGVELGGGSKRIHSAEMQKFVMREILKMSEERMKDFSHLFDALGAGCPPHAGFAIGFDRLVAVMTGRESVKDVIAFPKSSKGEDMMVGSPSRITDAELESYHLQLNR